MEAGPRGIAQLDTLELSSSDEVVEVRPLGESFSKLALACSRCSSSVSSRLGSGGCRKSSGKRRGLKGHIKASVRTLLAGLHRANGARLGLQDALHDCNLFAINSYKFKFQRSSSSRLSSPATNRRQHHEPTYMLHTFESNRRTPCACCFCVPLRSVLATCLFRPSLNPAFSLCFLENNLCPVWAGTHPIYV